MGNKQTTLNAFQREKLLHEFKTFYDMDKDGVVTWNDFQIAKQRICKLNRWPSDSEKAKLCEQLYADVWSSLQQIADSDSDGKITSIEWLGMWQMMIKQMEKLPNPSSEDLPFWLHRYLVHRFHVFDRTGDGVIDQDEYEYVMSEFNASIPDCRAAWLIFTENNTHRLDLDTFCKLATEYYFSTNPADLGNFIMGRLRFHDEKAKDD